MLYEAATGKDLNKMNTYKHLSKESYNKIREVGLYLTDTTFDAVERHVPKGKNHAYAALKLLPEAMTSDKFECLVGSISRRGKTSKPLKRPYSVMETVI